ncbi:unnamed protein product [Cuscuta epithymum]|uniref:Replication protein A 70 kDa DNA-binding subunit B/D first OB fold domain-containing protein n=1 Tax=Cuscuta epithymum TaxID=186058 RepID=A0AAV0GI98_9ASTE|nr:unnamed protein product [Cuscuta epithymum]
MAGTKSAGMWSLISETDHTKTTWALQVRVVRIYEVAAHARGRNTLEMVLHDEEGTRIHAVVKRPQVALFRPQVMEDNVYAVKNFMVLDNYQLYKTTSHPYILEFVSRTRVVHLDKEFPNFMYDLQPFEMLQAQRLLNDKLLIAGNHDNGGGFSVRVQSVKTVNGLGDESSKFTYERSKC